MVRIHNGTGTNVFSHICFYLCPAHLFYVGDRDPIVFEGKSDIFTARVWGILLRTNLVVVPRLGFLSKILNPKFL